MNGSGSGERSRAADLTLPVASASPAVVSNYLSMVASFHGQMMRVSSDVISAYLRSATNDPRLVAQQSDPQTDVLFSQDLPYIGAALPQAELWSVARSEDHCLPDDEAALSSCGDFILSGEERRIFAQLPNRRRRREWLLGRISVKECIMRLGQRHSGLRLRAQDVEIDQAADGKPFVSARTAGLLGWQPLISISHKDGTALAAACHPSAARGVGIDIETVECREDGFERLAFSEQEQETLAKLTGNDRMLLCTQLWCAKEAVGKALSSGLSNNPRSIVVLPNLSISANPADRIMIARRAAGDTNESFLVHCLADLAPNRVIAITALQAATAEQPL